MFRACPSREELQQFALGAVDEPVFERIARHVVGCAACETSLEALDHCADGLLTELRRVKDCGSEAPVAVPDGLLDLARDAVTRGSTRSSSEISIDPGRKYARRLADGPCRLGKFELRAELGVGSFGYVFRALDTELDRTVAVKVQRAGSIAGEEDVERFLREARSAAQLKHPNIVALYETGQTEEGVCYLVTEFVEGQTLESRLASGPLEPGEAAGLVADLAAALQYAHEHGVIHRDIKPSNILLDCEGRPHLMDFGLAKRDTGDTTVTSDGRVMGTPAYMSPEQARGESHRVDARTDIYSLGVVLYEMLTGERPFQGTRRMLLLQVLVEEPRPPRQLNDKIPRDLETICLKAMAKSPGRRYRSAGELGEDLQRYLSGRPIHARPMGYLERLWRWRRQNPLAVSLLLAVSIGSAVGFVHLTSRSRFLVEQTALDSARMQAEMLEEMNSFYSELVQRLEPHKVEITHEYENRDAAMPLPATFTIDAGKRISRSQSGMQVRLYSDYPFPWRKDGGPQDEFDREALRRLREAPEAPVHKFTTIDGRPVLRFAIARRMQQSCLNCHNNHPQSAKRDWKVGDVRGVLQITRPLERDIARTRSGLRSAFVLMGGIAASLVAICLAFLFGSRLRGGSAFEGR